MALSCNRRASGRHEELRPASARSIRLLYTPQRTLAAKPLPELVQWLGQDEIGNNDTTAVNCLQSN
jgi:hypothetical protein